MKIHRDSQGVHYRLSDLEDAHLQNIINHLECKARLGVRVKWNYGYRTVYGPEAEQFLELSHYREEQKRRDKIAEKLVSLRESVSELKAALDEHSIKDFIKDQGNWFTEYHFYCNGPKRPAYR